MNVFLWIVQGALAAAFAMSGLTKIALPKARLVGVYPWVRDFNLVTVRFIGVMGLLGAIGLIVPAAVGIAPILTPIAATGLAIIMVLAAAMVHIPHKEPSAVRVNAILFVLAALVAWGRFGPYGW
ncbi:DoxX family protein [Actinoallomurus acaciae]|uniref:DoxX family protein n=1 Tax=Actinoallomurus acaciae TaxID=502577 RepID=A0ABV5YUE9_9ACTN